MMNIMIEVSAILFILLLIISPFWFFSRLERVIRDDPGYATLFDLSGVYPNPLTHVSLISEPESMMRDDLVVSNLRRAFDSVSSPEMKRIWGNKLAKEKRDIKWNTLMAITNGSERTPRGT